SDNLHHVGLGGTEPPQRADQQPPDRLGVPNEPIVERQTQTSGLALRIEDVDHQQPWLTPQGRKLMASLGRLATAAPATGAHPSAIEADADPLACQGTMGGDREIEGRRTRRIPQMAPGVS